MSRIDAEKQRITTEIGERKQADTALGERIDTEKSERTTADDHARWDESTPRSRPASLRTPR